MKTKKRKSLIILVVMISTGLAFMAGCRHQDPEKLMKHAVSELTSNLDLTETQQQQLDAVKQEILSRIESNMEKREAARDIVLAQLESGNIDTAVMKDMVGARLDQVEETADLFIDRFAQFYNSLTPEQKAKFYEFMKKKNEAHDKIFSGLMLHR